VPTGSKTWGSGMDGAEALVRLGVRILLWLLFKPLFQRLEQRQERPPRSLVLTTGSEPAVICPACGGRLRQRADGQGTACPSCGRVWPGSPLLRG
jgi:hypothetical protein